jgi:hypothetical protein
MCSDEFVNKFSRGFSGFLDDLLCISKAVWGFVNHSKGFLWDFLRISCGFLYYFEAFLWDFGRILCGFR